MKTLITLIIALFNLVIFVGVPINVAAQCELIQNGNFESYSSCPSSYSQISYATYWHDANAFGAVYPSADYYNCSYTCFLTPCPPSAHSGAGFAGMNATGNGGSSGAEMIGTCANLVAGQTYTFSMWVFGGFDLGGGLIHFI